MSMRVGHGYDVHRLVPGRELILGGVKLEYELGLLGHSDADVLLHAICDALLGACALGDIGSHFPDSEEKYRGADSRMLLEETVKLIARAGYEIENIDSTVIAQKPKINAFVNEMRENIARSCGIDVASVSVKATTEEKLGFTGEGKGIAAHAVVLVKNIKTDGGVNHA